jgi:hypothetical protein
MAGPRHHRFIETTTNRAVPIDALCCAGWWVGTEQARTLMVGGDIVSITTAEVAAPDLTSAADQLRRFDDV